MARLHTSFASLIALLLAYMLGSALARLRTILFETLPKHDAPLRIALFGAASIAPHGLLYAAQRAQSVSVVSVASRSTAKARTLAAKWGIAHYGSYEEVLADANVDAVYIALINGAHYHWAAKALRAGKHVRPCLTC
jgi:D-arabinose 1-dehydrogenase-like Zn-dependent alcohol dehydrogenase